MKARLVFLIAFAVFSSYSHGANGPGRKTDIVTLYNGDRVTGELKTMYAGIVDISTHSMGTIKIEWQEIAKIESIHHYEIRMTEGKRYYGTIDKSPRPGEIKLSDVYGEHEISNLEVAEIRQVARSFKDRIDVYLAMGYSYTNASSLGQTTLNTEISYEDEKTRNSLTGRLTSTDSEVDITRSSKVDLARTVWTNRQDTFRQVTGTYETNDELGLDARYSVGGGLGRHFLDTQRSNWIGSVGAQVLTEKALFDGERQESVEGVFSTSFSTWKYTTPELHFKVDFTLYPSITESGRYRGDGDVNLRWEIIEDLYFDITAWGTYDNKAADDSRFDYGLSTGVGWTY
ncbi:MAG: DUF481 domain-containing protein [Halioglobus sp.]